MNISFTGQGITKLKEYKKEEVPEIANLTLVENAIIGNRQKYLESRGWTIERIWSRNWWKNPSAEIERIDQRIKELLKVESVREKVAHS